MGNSVDSQCACSAAAQCEKGLVTPLPEQPGQPPYVAGVPSSPSALQGGASSSQPGTARSTWDFNPIGHDTETLKQLASQLLASRFSSCGGTKVDVLQSFVKAVALGYRQNAFHNFTRAVDGLQAVCWQGTLMPWDSILTAPMRFALAVAAIAVNIGHPGFDNAFLVDVEDEIACCYNDISPLENMHCSRLFDLLKQDGQNVLGHLPSEVFRDMRKLMIDAILHTDPNCHEHVIEQVRNLCRQGHPQALADVAQGGSKGINQAFCRALLLSGDLSHQTRPWVTANTWAELLQSELGLQDQREQELGLPISPIRGSKPQRSDLQLHLGSSRVAPLLGAQLRLFPALQPAASQLADNAVRWAEELKSGDEKDSSATSSARALTGSADHRAKQICTLLDTSRPLPLITADEEPKSPDRFGYLSPTDRRMAGRRPSEQGSSKSLASQASTMASWTPAEQPPVVSQSIVREVRRWRETKPVELRMSSKDKGVEPEKPKVGRELVLLYIVSDDDPGSTHGRKPVMYRFLERDDASPEDVAAADDALLRGQRAAAADEVLQAQRRDSTGSKNSNSSSTGLPSGFYGSAPSTVHRSQPSADAVCTTVESSNFDAVLTSLLQGKPAEVPASSAGADGELSPKFLPQQSLRIFGKRESETSLTSKSLGAMASTLGTYLKI